MVQWNIKGYNLCFDIQYDIRWVTKKQIHAYFHYLRVDVKALMKASARDAPNKGRPFTFDQFSRLITAKWDPEGDYNFVEFTVKRFMAHSFLLGALRSTQFDRFRTGGMQAIVWNRENKDRKGFVRPLATACYQRVGPRSKIKRKIPPWTLGEAPKWCATQRVWRRLFPHDLLHMQRRSPAHQHFQQVVTQWSNREMTECCFSARVIS